MRPVTPREFAVMRDIFLQLFLNSAVILRLTYNRI